MRRLIVASVWLASVLLMTGLGNCQNVGTVTLAEGPLILIRGSSVFKAGEGIRIQRGDMLETSTGGFVQAELTGGGVVALGGSTKAYLLSHTPAATDMVVLAGWVKAEVTPKTGTYNLLTPLILASTHDGSLVVESTPAAASVFVESGSAAIGPKGSPGADSDTRAGQFFSRRAGGPIVGAPRPSATFIDSVPRQFRDTLPPRSARFSGKPPEPHREHDVSYSEVQPWLTMPSAWRRGFTERFRARLNDADFRRSLDSHMKEHPEWDRVLHPEKYETKTPPANTGTPQSPGR